MANNAPTQGGITPYGGPTATPGTGTVTPATPGGPNIGTQGINSTPNSKQGNIFLSPATNNPNLAPELDPTIANKVISISGGLGTGQIIKTDKATEANIQQGLGIRRLLMAYQHLYSPTAELSSDDVKELKGLGDKRITRFVNAYVQNQDHITPGDFLRKGAPTGGPGVLGQLEQGVTDVGHFLTTESPLGMLTTHQPAVRRAVEGAVGYEPGHRGPVTRAGLKATADAIRRKAGFSDPKELKSVVMSAVAKKIPGLNPAALSDASSVWSVQVPQGLVSKWNNVAPNRMGVGMTFNDLYTPLHDQNGQVVPAPMTPRAAQAKQRDIVKNKGQIDMGAQSAENAYQQLVKAYQNPSDSAGMVAALQGAGLLLQGPNDSAPTPAQVYASLATVVTTAANTGKTIQQVVNDSTTEVNNNPNLTAAGISNQAAEVNAYAANLGVNLTEAQRTGLIEKATQNNWQPDQISDAVAGYFSYTPGQQLTGRAASIWSGMQALQQNYLPGVPLSETSLGDWLTRSIKGVAGTQGTVNPLDAGGDATGTSAATSSFKQWIQNQAASMFPTLAPQIAQGVSTKTLIDPYASQLAMLLGYGNVGGSGQPSQANVADATQSLGINWSDPKYNRFLTGGVNPETGKSAPMSLDQARQIIITDPQYNWGNTSMAQNLAAHVGDEMLQTFGFYKPGGT
jgi:hypothetical protein